MGSKKNNKTGIVGVFTYLDDVCAVLEQIKSREDFKGYEVFSPCSYHELMEHAEERHGSSGVCWFTLAGGLFGVFAGFGLALWTDYDWPLVVGGKTPGFYSLPAYFIFGFEWMVLFGAFATIAGMLILGRLPNLNEAQFDPRSSDDRFSLFVPGADTDSEQAKLLQESGAEEVFAVS